MSTIEIVGTTCSVFVINRKISQNAQEIKIRQNNCGNGLPDNLKILLQIAITGYKNLQMPLKNKQDEVFLLRQHDEKYALIEGLERAKKELRKR